MRGVYLLEHTQQPVDVCGLGEHRSLLLDLSSQLSWSRFWQRFLAQESEWKGIQMARRSCAYNVIYGENTGSSSQLTPPPILITPIDNPDNIATVEGELSDLSGFKRMQGSYTRDQC